MAVPNSTITSDSDNALRLSKAFQKQQTDPPRMVGDMNAAREIKYWIYIFNVGPFVHRIDRPWAHLGSTGKQVIIPACQKGSPYSEPYKIPDVVQEKIQVSGASEFTTRGVDGKFLAQDVLNPDDPTGSWKSVHPINQGQTTNLGTNLYNFGCFWTLSDPPEPEALEKAKERMEAYFNTLITEANNMHIQGRDNEIGFTHRTAAGYFDLDTEWHKTFSSKVECPGCGEQIKPGIARCPHCKAVLDEKECRKRYPEMFKS